MPLSIVFRGADDTTQRIAVAAKVGIANYHFPCAPNVGKAAKRSAGLVAGGPFQKDRPPSSTSSLVVVLFKPNTRARIFRAPGLSMRRTVSPGQALSPAILPYTISHLYI